MLATSGAGTSSQGTGTGASALSPLAQSYNAYDFNRPYGNGLPRPLEQFVQGAFGPLSPIQPVGIDSPNPLSGRPDPRRFQYQPGWNLPVGQPGSEGVKLTSFANLRSLADTYSVARSCVDKCRQEILALEPDIVPTAEAEHAMRDDDKLRSDWDARRAKVVNFFRYPDSDRAKYRNFSMWLKALLEDVYVLDAVAVHLRGTRSKGAGPFGSDLASLDLLDGSTVRPLLNLLGATPTGGSVAYQQYVWGVPRVDMTSVMTDQDLELLADDPADGLRGEFRSDQLLYLRYEPRDWTPYGFGPIEKGLLPISIGMARQQYQWDYYQDGSVPGQFVIAGEGINTPQQIKMLQDALNAMAGDIGAKHRIIVLPPGSAAMPQKPAPLADQFDEWILSQVAMPFGLTPMDLGVTPRVSAVQTPSESKQLSQINTDKGSQSRVEPVAAWLKDCLFDLVIQGIFGQKDMEWSWGLTERGDNLDDRISQHVQKISFGMESVDEARIDLGEAPWGLPETSVPLAWLPTGPVPLQSIGSAQAPGAAPAGPGQLPAKQPIAALPAGGTQLTDEELTTPQHEAAEDLPDTPTPIESAGRPVAKTVRTEVEILNRHLRKGRPLGEFHTTVLTPEALLTATDALPKGVSAAASAAVAVLRRQADRARRESALANATRSVATGLGNLVRRFKAGDLATLGFTDAGTGLLLEGYRRALAAGSEHAHDDHPNTPTLLLAGDAELRAEQQRGWLMRLLVAILGAPDGATIARRLKLYADTLRPAYNAGYGATVQTAHPDFEIVWVLGETEHCELCLGRADKSFTFEDLPGYPGDGGFGGPICEGGQLCGCHLEYREGGKTVATFENTQREQAKEYYAQQLARITEAREQAAEARTEFVDSLPDNTPVGGGASTQGRARNRDELRIEMARLANARIRAEGGYPGVSVEPTDIPAKLLAQLLPPAERGGLKDLPQISLDQALDMYFAHKAGLPGVRKVGPHGYIHGWIFVGIPAAGADVFHPHHGHGVVTHSEHGMVGVRFDSGHHHTFETRPHPGGAQHSAGHFEPREPVAGTPRRPGPRELAAMSDEDLADSIVSDDDEHVANVLSELERRERVAAVAQRDQVRAQIRDHPPTSDNERDTAYQRLVDAGADSEDAFAEAYGAGSQRQRRDAAIAQLRTQGYHGRGFDGLARDAYRQEATRQYFTAEDATRGHMLNHAGRAAGIDPADLFSGPESRARRYASDELREWWQDNGRLTFEGFTANLVGQAAANPSGGYWL